MNDNEIEVTSGWYLVAISMPPKISNTNKTVRAIQYTCELTNSRLLPPHARDPSSVFFVALTDADVLTHITN